MKHKVILALGAQTAVAAAKKSTSKVASQPVMGALKGLLQQTLESNQKIEDDIDKAAESLENKEFALESENWQLTAAGAKTVSGLLKDYQREQKAASKIAANLLKIAAKAQAEMVKARVKDEPEAEEETQDDAEE